MLNLSEQVRGGTFCTTKTGLAIAGTTSKARTNNPDSSGYVNFCINGLMYSVADADNNVSFTAGTLAALYSCLYLVCISSANTITVVPGTAVLTANITSGKSVLNWPTPTANTCPIGAIRLDAGASAFTLGTTALTGGTVTVTYYDLFAVPDTPLTS